jgi:hypothetical protein
VKHHAYILVFVFFVASSTRAQTRPRPPGLEQAGQAEAQTEKNLPPPASPQKARLDPAKLRQEADELARISQTIPADVSSLQLGMLPKDMIEKLNQIEKLSKHLRRQISQ